jgi:hypothetical protein
MTTLLPPDQRLTITRELEMQLTDFWHEVDTNWGRNAADFYTEDGVFEASAHSYRGRGKIEEFYRFRLNRGPRVAVHAIANFRAVPQDNDNAISTWYLLLYADDGEPILPSAPPIQIAFATDTCVRESDGVWRYKHRKFDVWFKGGVPTTSPNLG